MRANGNAHSAKKRVKKENCDPLRIVDTFKDQNVIFPFFRINYFIRLLCSSHTQIAIECNE